MISNDASLTAVMQDVELGPKFLKYVVFTILTLLHICAANKLEGPPTLA